MNPGRFLRTVRHLSPAQVVQRGLCRGRFVLMAHLPGLARRRIGAVAERLPGPDLSSPRLLAAARHVALLQEGVHGSHLDEVREGRFDLLDRTLDFGGVDALDWRRNLGDPEWQLWRMHLAYMGYAVPLLRTGARRDLGIVLRLLSGLEAEIGWSERVVFRDAWNPYAASHRVINLLAGLALHRQAGGDAGEAEAARILDHVRFSVAFVAGNLERDLSYNHLLKNLTAFAIYRSGLADVPSGLAFLPGMAEAVLDDQVLSDGGHAERSPMYHALALQDARILRDSGVISGEASAARITRMEEALGVMSHPDGDIALFNDSWLGEAPSARALGAPEPAASANLPETGYACLSGAGDAVVFDRGCCGPNDNPAHAHADFLSIEASVGARRLVVDAGVATYAPGDLRDLTRSAASHNGPHLVGAEPVEFWGSFRVGRRGRAAPLRPCAGLEVLAPLWAAGWQSGYRRLGAILARFVGLWPGRGLLVADTWLGPHAHRAASAFLIDGAWTVAGGPERPRFLREERIVEAYALTGSLQPAGPAQFWRRYGVAEPAHRLVLEPAPWPRGRRAALLLSWAPDGLEPPTVERLETLFGGLADAAAEAARGAT